MEYSCRYFVPLCVLECDKQKEEKSKANDETNEKRALNFTFLVQCSEVCLPRFCLLCLKSISLFLKLNGLCPLLRFASLRFYFALSSCFSLS